MNDGIISVESTQYIAVPVSAVLPDGTTVNPTADLVEFAFLPVGDTPDGTATWVAGAWFAGTGAGYFAEILIGPAGVVTLPVGQYAVWLRIHDNPEVLVLASTAIQIV